ncbi:MAG: M3 family metallopeptidase [Roseomonas sp.]|nr:M3 family metallopeptidase [Roseomonas sp.]MCA3326208.1 M3 family metallopeptidase [Roseomonas sp.]MCA3330314.1 M3 family metallopeptidase [Roseomonas sp.]MCA3335236.1 M3 family metallopeptidase [Roseomonas sp.]MCA3346963.1 M3 family metallopeptidase [Roseomonas sp.]
MTENPLLTPWTTPFGLPPFKAIEPAHFPPAFEAAMAAHRAEIAEIGANPAAPDFQNTIEALESAGRLLSRIGATFFNLAASHATEALQQVERDIAPKLAAHRVAVALDPAIFRRVSALHENRDSLKLAPDQRRLLERLYLRLTRAGAGLAPKARARLAEISTRLATLQTAFGQNVLADENEWRMVLTEADLDGLPDFARQAAREAAAGLGFEGYVFTLSRSSAEPFLTFSARRDLRERIWRAFAARGALTPGRENAPLVREILMLRRERAQLLGEADFAAFRLRDTMAGSPEAAEALLKACWEPAKRRIAAERTELEEFARANGHHGPIEPWDWRYWAERARRAKHAFDGAALKPHFELNAMLRALFETAQRLFGLNFEERADIPRYHADLRGFEALDAAGNHVGLLLLDNYARPGKRSGAWMSSFRVADGLGEGTAPIIINNNNVARATPTLLSFDEARTLFHEFGHALHGLMSRARYPSQSGTAVLGDFVEFPSQIMEHWLSLPETLHTHARHHETGEALDEALLARVLAARNDGQGFAMVEYLSCALIDLALHRHEAPEALALEEFEAAFLAEIGMPEGMALRHRPIHFGHLFSGDGYAAGYYFYLWAEVLDADGFEAFEEAGNPFDPELAARLKSIFEAGDTADPMALYTRFRGRPPQVDALLRKRGLIGA